MVPIFEGEINEVAFSELIDTLFKIENEMNKFVTKSRALTDAKWVKVVSELGVVKTCEWPIKRDIYIWESLGEIKALTM